ncbi:amino acid adenylation domain-containing protein [Streptomyces anulatus]|uniref:amino acid adenylation domain-containing protein n=1 Tax=Streptomyces anulatus TaxID=1892 RepID=UPI00255CB27E|nr:amino acid adenylation domain-containing protein [Streptomyces anulatus]WIY74790.1 amino acid adenylation domain-containing protein [Streptomyces anulatus]
MHARLIHAAVAEQAQIRPAAPALIDGCEHLDYATLDAASDVYAQELAAAGVRPGIVVPVLLPRSSRLAVALLAVLKCGAAYAALDRRWPQERVAHVTAALRSPVLVTDESGPGLWSPPAASLARVAARRTTGPAPDIGPDAPAAVFFTSGTTGTPKGVLSPHRATTRLFGGPGAFADFGPGRVVLQAAPPAWDAFSMELWGPLTSGGTCVIAPGDYLLPDTLADLVAATGVDTVWLTSTVFNLFVDEDDPRRPCFAGVRQVLTGGERLSPEHVARFLTRYPETVLTNGYGPVESCVFATTHRVTAADCVRAGGIPIGTPVHGTAVHLLDGDRPAAPGDRAEICLSGHGLADGYLNAPEETAAAFPTVVLGGTPVRVYRTGDLGHLDADGVLHFHGRADRQVKISGHRIEPAEVEAAARGIPGVREAVVVPIAARSGGYERLAMFYTAEEADDPGSRAVRRALAALLPAHLVPRTVEHRAALPTTANGKVDHRSLSASL